MRRVMRGQALTLLKRKSRDEHDIIITEQDRHLIASKI